MREVSQNISSKDELTRILEKNRLLRKTAKRNDRPPKSIPKPKGSVGKSGFSLMASMGLDKTNVKERLLYNKILVSERLI